MIISVYYFTGGRVTVFNFTHPQVMNWFIRRLEKFKAEYGVDTFMVDVESPSIAVNERMSSEINLYVYKHINSAEFLGKKNFQRIICFQNKL